MSECMLVAMETYHLKLTLVNLEQEAWSELLLSDVSIVFSILEDRAKIGPLDLCYLY